MPPAFPLPDSGMPSLTDTTLDNTIGAAFIGVVCGAWLFGVNTLQAYLYYHSWYDDTIVHRISVGLLWVLDLFHLALTSHAVYHYTVTSFGHMDALMIVLWSIKLQIAVNVVIILLVQSLYAWRIWLLSGFHKGSLKYVVMLAVMGGFGIGIALSVKIYEIDYFVQLSDLAWTVDAALGAATAIDFILSGAMCYYLAKSKGHEGRLNSRISRVMQYTLSSGLFTSACSLSALFTYIFFPNTMIFFAIESLLTKLYVGSFFAMLNARERASDKSDKDSSYTHASSVRFSRKPSQSSLRRKPSAKKFLSLSSPVNETLVNREGMDSFDSQRSDLTRVPTLVPGEQLEYTALPTPHSAQLPRMRYGESSAPTTPTPLSARPLYAEQW